MSGASLDPFAARLRSVSGRPLRYVAVAAFNTLVGISIYPVLLWSVPHFREHYMLALGIAQIICLIVAFSTYKLGVFRTRGRVWREIRDFLSFYALNYALNWALLPVLVEVGGIEPVIAQTLFIIVLMIGSYFWHSRITFRGQAS